MSYKLPSDAGIQAEILSLASKMHRQVCARNTAFESVSRSNSLAKNSDGLLAIQLLSTENTPYSRKLSQLTPSNMDLQGYLTTDFLKQLAAQAALEKQIQDLNCQTHKTGGGKSQRSGGLLVSCRKDGLIAHVSEYQGPESLSPLYCFSGFLEAVISFHVHVHS